MTYKTRKKALKCIFSGVKFHENYRNAQYILLENIDICPWIKAGNPDMTNPQISTEASKRWKEMAEEEKRPYNKQAEIGKQKHEADMVEYKRTLQTTEA